MDHVQADGLLRWLGADLAETQVAILVVLTVCWPENVLLLLINLPTIVLPTLFGHAQASILANLGQCQLTRNRSKQAVPRLWNARLVIISSYSKS